MGKKKKDMLAHIYYSLLIAFIIVASIGSNQLIYADMTDVESTISNSQINNTLDQISNPDTSHDLKIENIKSDIEGAKVENNISDKNLKDSPSENAKNNVVEDNDQAETVAPGSSSKIDSIPAVVSSDAYNDNDPNEKKSIIDNSVNVISDTNKADCKNNAAENLFKDKKTSVATFSQDKSLPAIEKKQDSNFSSTTSKIFTANILATPVDGVCGSDNGASLVFPPTNLCSIGTPGPLTGGGASPWNWTCIGTDGGTTASCSANVLRTFSLNSSATAGGTISPSGSIEVNQGASQTYIITPDPGFIISDVTLDGFSRGPQAAFTISNVQASHTINAVFIPGFTINATAGAGGTISPAGMTEIPSGNNQTFTISPNVGYHIVDVLIDGVSQGPIASFAFVGLAANHTISAIFAIDTFTISATADVNSVINPFGTVTVVYGSSQTFTFSAKTGFSLAVFKIDNVVQSIVPNGSYTFENITANHSIEIISVLSSVPIENEHRRSRRHHNHQDADEIGKAVTINFATTSLLNELNKKGIFNSGTNVSENVENNFKENREQQINEQNQDKGNVGTEKNEEEKKFFDSINMKKYYWIIIALVIIFSGIIAEYYNKPKK